MLSLFPACDMFSWEPDLDATCRLHPHLPLKNFWWPHYTSHTQNSNQSVHILDCASAAENILPENDFTLRSPLWNTMFTGSCNVSSDILSSISPFHESSTIGGFKHMQKYNCSGTVTVSTTVRGQHLPRELDPVGMSLKWK
jgi:hypothetical protein